MTAAWTGLWWLYNCRTVLQKNFAGVLQKNRIALDFMELRSNASTVSLRRQIRVSSLFLISNLMFLYSPPLKIHKL